MNALATLSVAAAAPGTATAGAGWSVADWLGLEDPWHFWLMAFGLLGQAVFFARWIIQWIATERRGESHVPELFWWCSLIGAAMLFLYFSVRGDLVGMLGQVVGWMVYGRNLYLIRRRRAASVDP